MAKSGWREEWTQHNVSTGYVLGKFSNYILLYALIKWLNTNVHIEHFQSFCCVSRNSAFSCEIKHSEVFHYFKKIQLWTSDASSIQGTRSFPKENKLIFCQVWSLFSQKTLKQLFWCIQSWYKSCKMLSILPQFKSRVDFKIAW